MEKWYVWTISKNRYKQVSNYLEKLSNVKSFLYPTVKRQYSTKSGRKEQDVPLYDNYIFLKYSRNEFIDDELGRYPGLNQCIGPCSDLEIVNVKELSKHKYEDVMPINLPRPGAMARLINTPFVGMTCNITEVNGDDLLVSIKIFGSDHIIKCTVDDIDLER